MADPIVQVAGLATIKVAEGTSLAFEVAGYTDNGATIRFEAFHGDVPGDENGGDQGPPVEVQYFGEIAHIRLALTKQVKAVIDKIAARVAGAAAGVVADAGTLMFKDENAYGLLIDTPTDPYYFPVAIPRGAREVNRGTVFERHILELTAYKNSAGLLYSRSVPGG